MADQKLNISAMLLMLVHDHVAAWPTEQDEEGGGPSMPGPAFSTPLWRQQVQSINQCCLSNRATSRLDTKVLRYMNLRFTYLFT